MSRPSMEVKNRFDSYIMNHLQAFAERRNEVDTTRSSAVAELLARLNVEQQHLNNLRSIATSRELPQELKDIALAQRRFDFWYGLIREEAILHFCE